MTPDQAEDIIRRYQSSPAYPIPGKSRTSGIVELQHRIKQRLINRGIDRDAAYFRAHRIYERIMRYKPTFAQYCAARRAMQPIIASTGRFTTEQLQHMVDNWQNANDPMSIEIARIAALIITAGNR